MEFKDPLNGQIVKTKVISRAGKATGPNKYWWNMQIKSTGEKAGFDTQKPQDLRLIADK